ncbi:MAG: acyl-CoA dehydrogenase family protein [Euryarchaeota archaeon]|nr:acyl-CoA dehydrogenase family protein [Euryarchaeota archaeon]
MDWTFTDEQKLIRQTTRTFVQNEISPYVLEWEREGKVPDAVYQKMADQGIFGAPFPEALGGAGLDYLSYIVMTEELAKGCSSIRTTLSVHTSLCGMTILQAGSEEQKKEWIPQLADWTKQGAWALTEPGSGSDAASLRTSAERDGDSYVLNGRKLWISNGAKADYVVVFARVNEWDPKKKHEGITAFLVEKGTPGFEGGTVWTQEKLGLRSSPTAELILKDCRVPVANRIGAEGEGWDIIRAILLNGRISVAAGAVGIAQAALDASLDYAQTREQFGRPIADFQMVQDLLSTMATGVEAGRALVYKAAALKMAGEDYRLAVAQAKLFTAEMVVRVTRDAVQVHGGAGFSQEYPVERYFRDSIICGIYEGTNQIQKIIIARHLLGKED